MSRIPNTPPSYQHRERRVPLSKTVRVGLARKGVKAVSLPPAPWINKEKTQHVRG